MAHDLWRQQLRSAIAQHDASAIARRLDEELPDNGLQHAGDAILCALAVDSQVATELAARVAEVLRTRSWDGDTELADAIDTALGRRTTTLTSLELDLDLFAEALTEPPGSTGYLDLQSGIVLTEAARDFGDEDDADFDDRSRWLPVPGEGSAEPYRDMQHFIATVPDAGLARRLSDAIDERRPFRHFYDVIATAPAEHTRWQRYSDDARLGRARSWLADNGYQPAIN